MKYFSTRFEDYLKEYDKFNLHSNKVSLLNNIYQNDFKKESNKIFYGPSGIGKYTQALNYIRKYSPSNLKYERKMNFILTEKKQYIFKISDIHFEIDMELLGCNAKVLFNDLYYHILEIFLTRENHQGFILCKNFHKIHSELLDIFYSYMQTLIHKNINLKYIILTEHISFIPDNILNRCQIISFERPSKSKYTKCSKNSLINEYNISNITNIKNLQGKIIKLNDLNNNIIVKKIIYQIENYKKIDFLEFRDILYDIFIYDLDLMETIHTIINHFVLKKKIHNDNIDKIYYKLYKFLKFYNNNYRPIYHLESFMYYICIIVNGLSEGKENSNIADVTG